MSKFNKTTKKFTVTTNHEDAKAYAISPEMELYSVVVTSMLSNKFYESENSQITRIKKLITQVSPEFVAKLAVYARTNMYLRSIPLVLTVELAKIHSGDDLISKTVKNIVQRADEITELLAYYAQANNRTDIKQLGKVSNQIIKGLKQSFNKFDEYQFAKYNRNSKVTLKDALFITHPKAITREQQNLFDKITLDKLETPYTWEVELSKGNDKKETWEELIDSGKLGYMALLRNLRNIIQANVSIKHLGMVAERISNKAEVVRSRQFPFRFLSAYLELKNVCTGSSSMMLDALEEAMSASAENIKGFGYDTSVALACDVSGSMEKTISDKSKVELFDIGISLAMLLRNRCKNVITGMFGDTWKVINVPKNNILSNVVEYHKREGEVGYSTNGYKVIQGLIKHNEIVDKVMIFTDCQMWDSGWRGDEHIQTEWSKYKKIAPNAKLYLFDLAGYGDTPISINEKDVYMIAGWSDKVFDMLNALEEGSNNITEINKIEL